MRRTLATLAIVALTLAPAAATHGGGGALGFTSTVTSVTPSVDGLTITVQDSDDRLLLRNDTSSTITIFGYEAEPYLEFRDGQVFQNTRSPATYLNDDRYGKVDLPADADPKAEPVWEQVSSHTNYEWHDHRIHWMSTTLPPKVAAAKEQPHHVFNWKVPGRIADKPLLVVGTLDYAPPPGQKFPTILLLPLGLLVIGGAVAVWLRRRHAGTGPSF